MRLTPAEVDAIKQAAREVFGPESRVLLFGSRVDDHQKGGDIDLYIQPQHGATYLNKIEFLLSLERRIGEQKVDVVLATDARRPIEMAAIQTGVWL